MTRGLEPEFKTESEELVSEAKVQLESFENFAEQEKRIIILAERISSGRQKIQVLGARVDIVKDKVESWERAEGEWQDKTRKRLRILWIVMATIVAFVLSLVMFQYTPAMNQGHHNNITRHGLNASGLLGLMPDDIKNESWSLTRTRRQDLEVLRGNEQAGADDGRLRIFDEL